MNNYNLYNVENDSCTVIKRIEWVYKSNKNKLNDFRIFQILIIFI